MVSSPKLSAVLALIAVHSASAFTANHAVISRIPSAQVQTPTQLHIFGKAFANDDSLGKRENPGLKKVSALHCRFRTQMQMVGTCFIANIHIIAKCLRAID